jgi:hypothetical protein
MFKAALRAKEIATATWAMVLTADGTVGDALELPNSASKGKQGGPRIPLKDELRTAPAILAAALDRRSGHRISTHLDSDIPVGRIARSRLRAGTFHSRYPFTSPPLTA